MQRPHVALRARSRRTWRRRSGLLAALAGATLALTSCTITVPSDPNGTLDAARHGELRVGLSAEPGLIDVSSEEPRGPLVDLAEGFADSIDAQTDWTVGSEETLVAQLEAGDLDLVMGGMTSDSPWLDRAAMSRGYAHVEGADGRELVVLVPLGENAMLTAVEMYFDKELEG